MTVPIPAAVLEADMTYIEAQKAVSDVWHCIVLRLYHPTTAYYHEGLLFPRKD